MKYTADACSHNMFLYWFDKIKHFVVYLKIQFTIFENLFPYINVSDKLFFLNNITGAS